MEKTIEKQKNKVLKIGAEDHWDKDREIFWGTKESPVNGQDDEQDDHLDDEDLEYINAILNSFPRQNFNRKHSNGLNLESFTPGDARTRALAPIRTPQEFNLKFNQNLTSRGSKEEKFSYFSNVEEEGPTDLGNIFLTTKKTIVGTRKISQAKATPGAILTSTIPRIFHTHNIHYLDVTRRYLD
jgi:hypothetical protein